MTKNKKQSNKSEKHEAKKKYGQNFLEDSSLANKLINFANIDNDTRVLEIGPGLGFLTEKLINISKHLTAFEIDENLIPILTKKFGNVDSFMLIHKDFMEVNLDYYLADNKGIKVVANIPYYITSPIINKLLKYRKNISEIYLMVQKEVAERITSNSGSKNMSLLTHSVQFYAETEYLLTVPKEKFRPIPKVDSAFLKIKILEDNKYINQISEEEYFKYLKVAFSNKRKSVANNMTSLGYNKDTVSNILEKLGKTKLARTEEFSVQQFIDFIKELKNS